VLQVDSGSSQLLLSLAVDQGGNNDPSEAEQRLLQLVQRSGDVTYRSYAPATGVPYTACRALAHATCCPASASFADGAAFQGILVASEQLRLRLSSSDPSASPLDDDDDQLALVSTNLTFSLVFLTSFGSRSRSAALATAGTLGIGPVGGRPGEAPSFLGQAGFTHAQVCMPLPWQVGRTINTGLLLSPPDDKESPSPAAVVVPYSASATAPWDPTLSDTYLVHVTAMSVGNVSLHPPTQYALVDTGTPVTVLPRAVYDSVLHELVAAGLPADATHRLSVAPVSADQRAQLPSLHFHLGHDSTISLPPSGYLYPSSTKPGSYTLSLTRSSADALVLGANLLAGYRVAFDLDESTVTFDDVSLCDGTARESSTDTATILVVLCTVLFLTTSIYCTVHRRHPTYFPTLLPAACCAWRAPWHRARPPTTGIDGDDGDDDSFLRPFSVL